MEERPRRLILTTTTAGRIQFFKVTFRSLVANVEDLCLVDSFLHFDDGSSGEDRAQMNLLIAETLRDIRVDRVWDIDFSDNQHHARIMQLLYERILEYDYWFHCEDDWEFISNGPVLSQSIELLNEFPQIGQIGMWRTPYNCSIERFGSIRFWVYPHDPDIAFEHRWMPEDEVHLGWPHFSLRPAVTRVDSMRLVGNFECVKFFEYSYAKRWSEKGLKTAFLGEKFCRHLGATRQQSAYVIRGTVR